MFFEPLFTFTKIAIFSTNLYYIYKLPFEKENKDFCHFCILKNHVFETHHNLFFTFLICNFGCDCIKFTHSRDTAFFVPYWTSLYPDHLDAHSSLTPFQDDINLFFFQIYIFLASNWFPIFVLTGNTIFVVKKIQMTLKTVWKIFLWYFTIWSLQFPLITSQCLSFFGELSRCFSLRERNFRTLGSIGFA